MLGCCGHRLATYGAWLLIAGALVACDAASPTSPKPKTGPTADPNRSPTVISPVVEVDQWRTFRNEEFRYSIEIPPDCSINDTAKNEVIISVGPANGQAGLHILALEFSSTIDEFVKETHLFHQRRAAAYFETLSSAQEEMANGLTARRVAYRVQNHPRFCAEFLLDYLLLAGDLSYALQGSICEGAEGLYGEEMEIMQRSFRLDSDLATSHLDLIPANPYAASHIR